jgi:murein DD-endopeptidase MepM/ murein hydrolase activator NlpD
MTRTDARILLAFVSVLALGACSTANGGSRTAGKAGVFLYGEHGGAAANAGMHTVARNETVQSIAQAYRVSAQDIITVNRLPSPYHLNPGQRIVLPPPPTYSARPGDSAYAIAHTFNVSTHDLLSANNIGGPFAVRPGQTLHMPAAKPAPQPAPAVRYVWTQGPPPVGYAQRPVQTVSAISPAASYIGRPYGTATPPHLGTNFIWPVNGPIVSAYGAKTSGLRNDGINIGAWRGAPVHAADFGEVVFAGAGPKGYGNIVLIRHRQNWVTAYAHLDHINVHTGQMVRQGQKIAAVGASGAVSSPQLHFEVRKGTEALNPVLYLRGEGA